MTRQRYRRRPQSAVVAVQMNLDTRGLHYRKWGHEQHGKPGDWLVDNAGDVYTVDAASFAATYRSLGQGTYIKTTPVWAERASASGQVKTKEGTTAYAAGSWLVSNHEDGSDPYAVSDEKFRQLYEPDAPAAAAAGR